jgi:hypothetical protein
LQSARVSRAIRWLTARGWTADKIVAHAALLGFRFQQPSNPPMMWSFSPATNQFGARWSSLPRAAMAALLQFKSATRVMRKLRKVRAEIERECDANAPY